MTKSLSNHLQQQLQHLDQQGLRRNLVPLIQAGRGRIAVSGKTYVNLSGNDYLGLASNEDLVSTFYSQLAPDTLLESYGPGATASRLMTGNSTLYEQLEQKLADLYNTEKALVFNSGYHGNVGILPVLAEKGDLILADKLCHASLIDGMRLSRADVVRYRHQDYDHLTRILEEKRKTYNRVFLVTESVFSMDGDMADLHQLIDLKKKFDCVLYLDEAHAVGLFGPQGLGLAEQEGVASDIDLLFGTFGKAMGGQGGFLVCSQMIYDYLVTKSRSLIYSTGLPPVCLNWLLFILELVPKMSAERKQLQELASTFRKELTKKDLTTGGSSQIIPVIIGESNAALSAASKLRESGYWVTAVRPPTVPANTARLRISLSTSLSQEDLAPLPELIADAL